MAVQSNIYAGVAGYVGRPEEKGKVGVFRRAAAGGEWQHVLTDLATHTVFVHPADPSVVFAGTVDGVWRSTDRGATFQRTRLNGSPASERMDVTLSTSTTSPVTASSHL